MLSLASSALLNSTYAIDHSELRTSAHRVSQAIVRDGQASAPTRPQAQQFGYHNTFHLHVTPAVIPSQRPPAYQQDAPATSSGPVPHRDVLPRYTCTVSIEGQLGIKCELTSPFMEAPPHSSQWHDIYAQLHGTQLRIYKLKVSGTKLGSNGKQARPGKLVKAYSLQHAEVGVAADFQKGEPVPRSTLGKLMSVSARQKLFETDPHLFEPLREYAIRLRIETEQLLLCARSQTEMLDWTETLAAAIDISMPLEDRSEPKYRSLPRRARRQRELDGGRSLEGGPAALESQSALVRQQEQLFRELYPHLAAEHDVQRDGEAEAASLHGNVADSRLPSRGGAVDDADPEADDLDRMDALMPTASLGEQTTPPATESAGPEAEPMSRRSVVPSHLAEEDVLTDDQQLPMSLSPTPTQHQSEETASTDDELASDSDSKSQRRPTPQLSPASALRFRRRCAPVLLEESPRASIVTITPILKSESKSAGQGAPIMMRRVKIDVHRLRLVPFEQHPPKYDAHGFDSTYLATVGVSRPGLERGDTASTTVSTVSSATGGSLSPTSTNADVAADQASELDEQDATEPMAATVSSSDAVSASVEELAAANAGIVTAAREVCTGRSGGASVPPSPTTSVDMALAKKSTNKSTESSQALTKKSRRISLTSRFTSKKADGHGKRADRAQKKPVIPASQAAETHSAAYAAMMF